MGGFLNETHILFCCFYERRSCCVVQAGLPHMGSGDPIARTTGIRHHSWFELVDLVKETVPSTVVEWIPLHLFEV